MSLIFTEVTGILDFLWQGFRVLCCEAVQYKVERSSVNTKETFESVLETEVMIYLRQSSASGKGPKRHGPPGPPLLVAALAESDNATNPSSGP